MIYNKDIIIPVLCPLHFDDVPDIKNYPWPAKYTGKLLKDFDMLFSIPESIYTSGLEIRMECRNTGRVFRTYYATKSALSDADRYASLRVMLDGLPTGEPFVFRLLHGSEILAETHVVYTIPAVTKDITTLKYSNSSNDWNTIFIVSTTRDIITLNGLDLQTLELVYAEDSVTLEFNCAEGATEFEYFPLRVKASNELGIIGDFTTAGLLDYVHTFDAVDFVGHTSSIEISKAESGDPVAMFKNIYFGLDFNMVKPIEYFLSLEGGFNPNDFKPAGSKEEFFDQDYMNTVMFAQPYETEQLSFGGALGIPNWLAAKLNYVLMCPDLGIFSGTDDQYRDVYEKYELANGGNFEKQSNTYAGLATYKVQLQDTGESETVETSASRAEAPAYATITDISVLTALPKQPYGTDIVLELVAESFTEKQAFDVPVAWGVLTEMLQFMPVFGQWMTLSQTPFTASTGTHGGKNYNTYVHNGTKTGARTIKLRF